MQGADSESRRAAPRRGPGPPLSRPFGEGSVGGRSDSDSALTVTA